MKLYNITKNIMVSDKIEIADTFLKRLLGLIPKKNIQIDSGLMIKNCKSVHTCFMSFTIDVVFTNRDLKVIDIVRLKPWSFSKFYIKAENAFEFTADYVYDKISVGDILSLEG